MDQMTAKQFKRMLARTENSDELLGLAKTDADLGQLGVQAAGVLGEHLCALAGHPGKPARDALVKDPEPGAGFGDVDTDRAYMLLVGAATTRDHALGLDSIRRILASEHKVLVVRTLLANAKDVLTNGIGKRTK